jgi:NifB/MoaA-like Fe-S oxidoreductase
VRDFLDEWEAVKREIAAWQDGRAAESAAWPSLTLVTGALFGPTLQATAEEFSRLTGAAVRVLAASNRRLGPTITVAGLLLGQDVLGQLRSFPVGDLILLPRVMFDHPQRIALDDTPPQAIADTLGRPVILADTMGDVWDALIGQSAVVYRPSA